MDRAAVSAAVASGHRMMNSIGEGKFNYYDKPAEGLTKLHFKPEMSSDHPELVVIQTDGQDDRYLANEDLAKIMGDILSKMDLDEIISKIDLDDEIGSKLADIEVVTVTEPQLTGRSFDEPTLTPITILTLTQTITKTDTATTTQLFNTTRTFTDTIKITSAGCSPTTQWMATGGPTITSTTEMLFTKTETATETTTVHPEGGLKKIFYDTDLVKPEDVEGIDGLDTEALDKNDMVGALDALPDNYNLVLVNPDSIKTPDIPDLKDAFRSLVARGAAAPAFIPSVRSMALGMVAVGGLVMAL